MVLLWFFFFFFFFFGEGEEGGVGPFIKLRQDGRTGGVCGGARVCEGATAGLVSGGGEPLAGGACGVCIACVACVACVGVARVGQRRAPKGMLRDPRRPPEGVQ